MARCPHCGEVIERVRGELITSVDPPFGIGYLCMAYSCPREECGKIISITACDENAKAVSDPLYRPSA
jgi:hypothetical protein